MEEELNQVRAENNNREIGCTRTKDEASAIESFEATFRIVE
jgi:hypothetical protein